MNRKRQGDAEYAVMQVKASIPVTAMMDSGFRRNDDEMKIRSFPRQAQGMAPRRMKFEVTNEVE